MRPSRPPLSANQKHRVTRLAETPADAALTYCPIPGCGRLTRRQAGRGFSQYACQYHDQWKSRHGSYWKRTYTRAQLKPYRSAARIYLHRHREDDHIRQALRSLDFLLVGAGPNHRVVDTLTMKPREKARAALARMRKHEVPSSRLLEIIFAVSAAVAEDPIRPGGEPHEFRRVQIAKACMRQASGQHSHYGLTLSYHRYPRSGGLLLRHLGAALDGAADWALHHHLRGAITLKQERYGAV